VRVRTRFAACLAAGLSAAAALAMAARTAADAAPSGAPVPHVMVIMMENTDYSQAIGSPAMPYLNELAHEYAGFTQAYGVELPESA